MRIFNSETIGVSNESNLLGDFIGSLRDLASMPMPQRILMVEPTFFTVEHPTNVHMKDSSGNLNRIDHSKAVVQWQALKAHYMRLGFKVEVHPGVTGCSDMVFCANPSFPFISANNSRGSGKTQVIISHMRHPHRQREQGPTAAWLENLGCEVVDFWPPETASLAFEGTGDALWVPKKRLICAGYGPRTDLSVYEMLSEVIQAPIVCFKLANPSFYHLDTCLSIFDQHSAMACRAGFTEAGWKVLGQIFPNLLDIPIREADTPGFATNAHCPDGKHVLIQSGNQESNRLIRNAGFEVIETDTSEFIKSGGSVFCMKQILF